MYMMKRFTVVALALLAAGCSGGGGSTPNVARPTTGSPGGGTTTSSVAQRVTVSIHVPAKGAVAALAHRKPNFVSPDTNFATVTTYTSNPSANPKPASYSTVTSDISTDASSTCTRDNGTNLQTGNGPRTCTITVDAPAGTDYFVFTTSQTSGGAVLAQGMTSKTITVNTTNTVSVVLGGVISSFQYVSAYGSSFDASFDNKVYFSVAAFDAAGDLIVAGAADPYVNPITVTQIASSSGAGTGNSTITVTDGTGESPSTGETASASTPKVYHSSDGVIVNYSSTPVVGVQDRTRNALARDIAAKPPLITGLTLTGSTDPTYYASVTTTAVEEGYVDPIDFVLGSSTSSPNSTSKPTLVEGTNNTASSLNFTASGQSALVQIVENTPGYPGGTAAAFVESTGTCPAGLTVTQVDATHYIIGPGTAAYSTTTPCVLTFSDQYLIPNASHIGYAQLVVTSTTTTAKLQIPVNAVYATDNSNNSFQVYDVENAFQDPYVLAINGASVAGLTAPNGGTIAGIAHDASNNVYVGIGNSVQEYSIGNAGYTLTQSETLPTQTGQTTAQAQGLAVDKAHNLLLVADDDGDVICAYGIPLTAGEKPNCTPLPSGPSGAGSPLGIAVDANSTYYVVDDVNDVVDIAQYYQGGAIMSSSFPLTAGAPNRPVGIAVDQQQASSIFVNQGGMVYRYDSNTVVQSVAANHSPASNASVQLTSTNGNCTDSRGVAVLSLGNDEDFLAAACPTNINNLYYNGPTAVKGGSSITGFGNDTGDTANGTNNYVDVQPVYLSN